jgi:hypothetical protein
MRHERLAAKSAAKAPDGSGPGRTAMAVASSAHTLQPAGDRQLVNDRSAAGPARQARARHPGHSQTRDRTYPGVQHVLLA